MIYTGADTETNFSFKSTASIIIKKKIIQPQIKYHIFHEVRMFSQTYYKYNINSHNFKHSVWKFQSITLWEQRNGERERKVEITIQRNSPLKMINSIFIEYRLIIYNIIVYNWQKRSHMCHFALIKLCGLWIMNTNFQVKKKISLKKGKP